MYALLIILVMFVSLILMNTQNTIPSYLILIIQILITVAIIGVQVLINRYTRVKF